MHNPFDRLANDLKEMNQDMLVRLDRIINRLDILIAQKRDDQYGDGK